MTTKPIPAFYCCYLLRSTVAKTSLYVGSTPNPVRRLAQHNGYAKGGAVKTARGQRRPWEMTVIVSGFPSKIAALQFEWAWHNPHVTKKIASAQRITFPVKKSPKRGHTRGKMIKPFESLATKIANLHLLLQVPGFARWPLQVRFFCSDVHEVWKTRCKKAAGPTNSRIKVLLDVKLLEKAVDQDEIPINAQAKGKRKRDALGKGGVDGLDVSYNGAKTHVEKGISLLAQDEALHCAVCSKTLGPQSTMALVCPRDGCRTASHMTCLAAKFRTDEGQDTAVVPTSGRCPVCKEEIQWIDLVKEMSLRARGEKEVAQLMKKPRERKPKLPKKVKLSACRINSDDEDAAADPDGGSESDADAMQAGAADDDDLPDDWHFQEDDDVMSVTSAASGFSDIDVASPTKTAKAAFHLGVVIEDSEWDEAEILD